MKPLLKYFSILFITCLTVYLAFIQLGKPLTGIDDANIFFVYARNLAKGLGFVYQPGGERVEGFSSPLWVLICSAGFLISKNPEKLLIVFNIILISLTIYNFVNFIDSKYDNKKFISLEGILALIFIFANPIFISWTTLSLMETGVWTFLIINSTIFLVKFLFSKSKIYLFIFSILIFLTVFTRPEGVLTGGVMIFLLALGLKLKERKILPNIYLPVILFLLSILILFGFRVSYFGYIFPNTFYAKVSNDIIYSLMEGIKYFIKFFLSNTFVFIIVSGIIYYFTIKVRKRSLGIDNDDDLAMGILNIIIITGIVIPILWGGDVFIDFRFYQPYLPLMFIPLIYFFKLLIEKLNSNQLTFRFSSIIIIILFFLFCYTGAQIKYHQKDLITSQQYKIAEENREFGNKLNEFFNSKNLPVIGTIPAGGLAYTYNGKIIDLLGLNNIEMAHSTEIRKGLKNHASFNKMVFYKQSPDFILAGFDTDSSSLNKYIDFNNNYELNNIVLKGILNDAGFREKYEPALIGNGKEFLFAYYRKDYIQTLKNEGFWVKSR